MNKLEIEGFNITLCIVQKSTSTPGKLRPRSIVNCGKFNYCSAFQTCLHGLVRAVGVCHL